MALTTKDQDDAQLCARYQRQDWIDFDWLSGPNNGAVWVFGYEGNDTIFGFGGNDRLMGIDGDDDLFGGDENDRLIGGVGADWLHGGNGEDEADYSGSASGVTVSLVSDMASGGDAAGDELDSIENLNGSAHADTLIGDNGVNLLFGEGGNDTLKGYGGMDFIWGGLGNDSTAWQNTTCCAGTMATTISTAAPAPTS